MTREQVELRLLGTFEVRSGGRLLRPGQPKQQALLALLALRRGTVVSISGIVDALWDGSPPRTARNQIQVYVAGLRRIFSSAGASPSLIETRAGAYLLDVPAGSVDLFVFAEASEKARRLIEEASLRAADQVLQAAMGLWRGPAFSGLTGDYFEQAAQQLEERRLATLEQHLHVKLALGQYVEIVSGLRPTVAAHPMHEGLRYGLMLALYLSGRSAEALAVYGQGRRKIVDELGIEPGSELRSLQQRILRGEPPPVDALASSGRLVNRG